MTHLQSTLSPEDELCFVIGPDNASNWDKFYKAQQIKQQWQLIVVPERKTIRSTFARQRLQNDQDASELLTPSVLSLLINGTVYTKS